MSEQQTTDEIFNSAGALWDFLTQNAGLDTVFYDREILDGNGVYRGLYEQLQLDMAQRDFGKALREANVPVEEFVLAFFNTLQPYAQMMSGICAFFERHRIRETDKSLKIVFDFSQLSGNELEFDLNSFRSTLSTYQRVQRMVEYFHLRADDYYTLIEQFADNFMGESTQPEVIEWIKHYKEGHLMPPDGFTWPVTANELLNKQLTRLRNIWRSFMNACFAINMSHANYHEFMERYAPQKITLVEADFINGYLIWDLALKTSDYWPVAFINSLFHTLEKIGRLEPLEASEAYQMMAIKLEIFLDSRTVSQREEEELTEELADLLKLPIWNKRHELYAAWILSMTDEVMAAYPNYRIIDDDGVLCLKFQPTLLGAFDSAEGPIELWSEVRSPIDEPEGKSRTSNIQPDYTFYKGGDQAPGNGIAVVEVKQYRKPSRSNFQAALNDYAKALPNAHVFLVNYGAVPEKLNLLYEARSVLYGQVKPGHPVTDEFKAELSSKLPLKRLPEATSPVNHLTLQDCLILVAEPIDILYVDISRSLDNESYKTYVRSLLHWLLANGDVKKLVAVDTVVRGTWLQPDIHDIDKLLDLPFDDYTDFGRFIEYEKDVLMITDREGLDILRQFPLDKVMIIHFRTDDTPEFITADVF